MITKSKLANQPKNKLTNKFQPIDMSVDETGKRKKKWKRFVLLPLLLIVVAGATFGAIWGINLLNKSPVESEVPTESEMPIELNEPTDPEQPEQPEMDDDTASVQPITSAQSANPTIGLGRLMLINPNFTVERDFIAARKNELISMEGTYGVVEGNRSTNGDNLLDKEAAAALNKMNADYTIANPGHSLQTRSCFREVGTSCGRMCAATGTSDHHTGLTCDLIDPIYGNSLDTGEYNNHIEWQWLKNNSYKYGFIDRFPEAWAGGPMSEPANVDENGTTGLFETWHYRYVGVYAATQIATGVYNNGQYDSLEHYLKARGLVSNLLNN